MKFYSNVQKIILTQDLLVKAKRFAEDVTITTNYSDASQTQGGKIINDHYISKLGEEAVRILMSRYAEIKGPDYAVYEGKHKSWEADLFVNGIPLAVKTQTTSAAIKYGLSWTFQNGIKRRDVILQQPDAWVVLVEYDDTHAPYQTCFVLPPYQVKELVFSEPRLAYLKAHKRVVYAFSLGKMEVEG